MTRFLLLGFISSVLLAQPPKPATLTGTITDPSGAAVANAQVRLTSRDDAFRIAARTADDGRFTFDNLQAGEYWLQAVTEGFDQTEPLKVRLNPGESAEVNQTLNLERLAARVEVTATATAESTIESGKALDIVDSAELSRRSEFSFTEAIRLVPGLRVQQLGGPGSFTRVLTRGLRATDSGILIDGMRFRDAGSVQGDAAAFLGDIMMGVTERVEVLRGSGSSVYGTHATGGVINLVTDQGGGPLHAEVASEGGGLGLVRGLARMSGGAWHDRLQFAGGLQYLNVMNGVDGIERVRNWSGQGFVQYRVLPNATLSARVLAVTSMVGVNVNPQPAPNLPPSGFVPAIPLTDDQVRLADQGLPFQWGNATFAPNLFDPDSRRIADFTSTMTAWRQQVNPRVSYRISYQNLVSNRDNRDGPGGPGFQPLWNTSSAFGGQIDTIQARTDVLLARWNSFTAGYEFEREYYNNPSSDQNPDPAQRLSARTSAVQRSNSVFAQDTMRALGDRLQLSLSGRFQGFRLDRPVFEGGAPQYVGAPLNAPPNAYTGDAALSYFLPSSGTKLRAHVGNAYRAPALYERFGAYFYMGQFGALGDPRLRPERSLGLDFGVDQYLAANRLRVSASYFYTRLQEVIGYGDTPNDPFGRYGGYLNTGGGLARGAEVSVEAKPSRGTTLQASYTYVNADERNSTMIGGTLASIRVFPHTVTFVASQQVGKRTLLTADYWWANQYIGGTFFTGFGIRPYIFGGPNRLDLSAQYTVPLKERVNLRLFTRVENVLNQRYYEEGFRTPHTWATAGLKLMF